VSENDAEGWSGEDRRAAPKGWTFKREVSLGNVLTILLLATPLFIWAVNLDKHVAMQDVVIVALQRTDDRHDQQIADLKREIQAELIEISHKLDRLNERNGR